jgi:hypothetical protein
MNVMPRQKGSVAIKFLDATQDDVAMRNILWRGDDIPLVYERKLTELYTKAAHLAVQQMQLRATIKVQGNMTPELAKAERKLRSVETALRDTNRQIDEALREMPRSCREKAACGWQEMAVRLIMAHKRWEAGILTEGEFVLGTKGATISTKRLQQLLRERGFRVGERQLRRFIHDRCGVVGQQGKRTDLTS